MVSSYALQADEQCEVAQLPNITTLSSVGQCCAYACAAPPKLVCAVSETGSTVTREVLAATGWFWQVTAVLAATHLKG